MHRPGQVNLSERVTPEHTHSLNVCIMEVPRSPVLAGAMIHASRASCLSLQLHQRDLTPTLPNTALLISRYMVSIVLVSKGTDV